MVKSLLFEHEMHMSWSHRMSPQLREQLPHRPIMRNRIRYWDNRFEPEDSLLIARHNTPAVWPLPIRVLDIIFTSRIRLPDIDLCALDRLAVDVFDGAEHEKRFSCIVFGHQVAVGHVFRLVGVEGTQDGSFGRVGRFGMVDGVDKQRQAEDVGEEDEFLDGHHG